MKIIYHSAYIREELAPDTVFRTIPCKAVLELQRDKNEGQFDLLYNGTLISSDTREIKCNEAAELIVRKEGSRRVYTVGPSIQPLSLKYAGAYEQFSYEYRDKEFDEISSIQRGGLRLYAVDQSAEVYDWTDIFKQVEDSFAAFKAICEKPKSHLKAVNEVRPIEMVKRIGYESIPYLAAHSEDWLARTASGLKPARLFSRVEDDEFQIYENRVVKTLIDLILGFLRRTEKQLRDQRDQLRGIIDSGVQTGCFGFDVSFQKAVSELMSSDNRGNEYRSKNLELVEKLQAWAYLLLRKYRTLRQSRLYRYLKKAKPIQNPLRETNILVLDKYYSVIFRLWKIIHHVIAPGMQEDENSLAFGDICNDYQKFCGTLCGYGAHVLNFELIEDGIYFRKEDYIQLVVESREDGGIRVELSDKEPRIVEIPKGVDVPVAPHTDAHGFFYDGKRLSWANDISDEAIEAFCSLFKTKESRGREQSEEKRKYAALKSFLDQTQRSYDKPLRTSFLIIPLAVELGKENRTAFKNMTDEMLRRYHEDNPNDEVIIGLPVCNENEQKLTDYAREAGRKVAVLPLTMFDINSFRRLQNVLYRHILKLNKGGCLNCGKRVRECDNQWICDSCNQLTLTKTICPNPKCKQEYFYLKYDVSQDTIQKMQGVKQENFFQWDSLYQYKDMVNMTVDKGKIRTVCPYCHQS